MEKCVDCFLVYLFLEGFVIKKCKKKCVYTIMLKTALTIMLKTALLLVKNVFFDVKNSVSENVC